MSIFNLNTLNIFFLIYIILINIVSAKIFKRICSNAGNCTCRECNCLDGYSGLKCECNDRTCPSHNGSLCGGE